MNILVTGSLGTLGVPLCKALRATGHRVFGADLYHHSHPNQIRADIAEFDQIRRVMWVTEPDMVVNLAAEFGRHNGQIYSRQLWNSNCVGLRNILDLQEEFKFRLIHASSSEIYGEPRNAPDFWPEDYVVTRPVFPGNDYAISKWANELQISNHIREERGEAMILRLFNAYGPGEYYHPFRSVVCLFCHRALTGEGYTVFRDYHRVFMFVDDLMPTLVNAVQRFAPSEIVNIGGVDYHSVEELDEVVRAETGLSKDKVTYVDKDAVNVVNKRPDISKAQEMFGHAPKVGLREGIPITVGWMRKVMEEQ